MKTAAKNEQLVLDKPETNQFPEPVITASQSLKNAFRALQGTQIASRSTAAARAIVAVDTIRLQYPWQLEAMQTLYEAKNIGRDTRGRMQAATCLFAPSHTGKTIAAQMFTEAVNEDAEAAHSPVVLVSMGTGGGPLEMHRQILTALGEGFPATKDLAIIRSRSVEAMIDAGVELLIIDEVHEACRQSGGNSSFTSELKTLLNGGYVGIVLIGTNDAEKMIYKDQEVAMRTMAPFRFGALNWENEEERELWIGFLSALDCEMLRLGIVKMPSDLDNQDLAMALWTVCQGVIGQLMNVMKQAIRIAIHDGREFITVDDLALAVDDRLIATKQCKVNSVELLAQVKA